MLPLRLPTCVLLLISGWPPAQADPAATLPAATPVVQRDNAEQQAALLTPGQRALLEVLPDTYRIVVAPATAVAADAPATAAGPPAQLTDDGGLAALGPGVPFPKIEIGDTDGGLKAIWNHRLRQRGSSRERTTVQAVTHADGAIDRVEVHERLHYPAGAGAEADVPLVEHLIALSAPMRLAGSLRLVREPLTGPASGQQRSPGSALPIIKATAHAGGDTSVIGTDGLLTEDQIDGFRGDPGRWRWRLLERTTRLVPWNATALHAHDAAPESWLTGRHPDPARLRHEPRDVLHLEARLRPGSDSAWPPRHFYLDAATWQVVLAEYHGRDGDLDRVHEIHVRDLDGRWLPMASIVHDLPGRRYLVTGIELQPLSTVPVDVPEDAFTIKAMARWAKALGAGPLPRR